MTTDNNQVENWNDPEWVRYEMEYREDAAEAQNARDRAAQIDNRDNSRPTEPYRVELWPEGRGAEAPAEVTVVSDHPQRAAFAAMEKHGAAEGLTYEDFSARPVAAWQPAPVSDVDGRAR